MTALNPVLTVGHQIAEPLRRHLRLSRRQARKAAMALLDRVGIPGSAPARRQLRARSSRAGCGNGNDRHRACMPASRHDR